MSTDAALWAAWAKAGGSQCHPLMGHVLDTAAVAERLMELVLGPRCREELRAAFEPLGQAERWIATLCGLHDLGKYSPTFQGLQVELAVARFDASAAADVRSVRKRAGLGRRIDTPHGLVTTLHLKDLLLRWGASPDTAEVLAVALGGHHGHFPDGAAVRQARREVNNHGGHRWRGWRDDLVSEVLAVRGLAEPSETRWQDVHVSVGAAVGFAALTTISDWIASDTENFPYADGRDLPAYAHQAEELAVLAVDRLGLRPWTPPARFGELFPGKPPRPVQVLVEQMTLDRDEPSLIIVEAPTGEGKSKAALQAAAALMAKNDLMGTYVAMPTQATSNQMLIELEELVAELGDDVTVRLIHSTAKDHLSERATTPTGVGYDEQQEGDVGAQEWFTRKKNLLAPVGVGTIDQALKAVIRSGHDFVRLAALANKVVVIDEVHAYDTYMSTLLDRLLAWLGRLGTSVVMLSATLPSGRRQELVAAWQSGLLRCLPREVPAMEPCAGYPRVSLAGTGRPVARAAGVSKLNTDRTLRLSRVRDEDVVDWALGQAAGGRSVVVMHNLVRRAAATHAAVEKRIAAQPKALRPRLIMINGRLAVGARRVVEAELQAAFGEGGERPRQGAIVVSTQVLEQGLDLDFDAMLSDLAPVDWLIQRAGRLHRHSRDAARGEPVLAIAGVVDTETGPLFPPYLETVYAPMTLLRTWALLHHRTSLDLPGEVPGLVDALYGAPEAIACPAGWEEAWRVAAEKLERKRKTAERNARLMYLPHPSAVAHLSELTRHSKHTGRTRDR
ncbi:CRISPR-associated helicase Cas3' [Streptosporangium sp. NPDC049248]|uniref:CRISPR-associated helicase Cas3' n=1 Tax=Streptosporangium sp. NPDC049248 TaxID=3155651 RepID=UPI0034406086